MIKSIALAAIFFAVSAISISTATATSNAASTKAGATSSQAPVAPIGRGFCPGGHC